MSVDARRRQPMLAKFNPGDIVAVKGYAGAAKIVSMTQDGVTPQGYPKWLCTVEFGALNPNKLPDGIASKRHDFYAGRLTHWYDEAADDLDLIDYDDVQQVLAAMVKLGITIPDTSPTSTHNLAGLPETAQQAPQETAGA